MESRIDFDLNESLKTYLGDSASISTADAPSFLLECETNPEEALSPGVANEALNPVVDAITENPESITQAVLFDTLQFLLKHSAFLVPTTLSKLFDLVISGLAAEADAAHGDIEGEEPLDDGVRLQHKLLLEVYAFLLQWCVAAVENKATEKGSSASAAPSTARGRGGGKKAAKPKSGRAATGSGGTGVSWDPSSQLQLAMETIARVMRLKLSKVFEATSERDTFIGLFTRPMYLLLENEGRVKSTPMRMHIFKVLCMAVKHHGHAFGAQTSIIQNLSYFEHLSEPMAEFLFILADQYDYSQLAEEILRELSNKQFNSNDTKGPKSVSLFITKLSELAPRLVMKQMTVLGKFLDNESYTLRCSIIEVCGNLIAMLSTQSESAERGEQHKAQIGRFFDVLEERFLDINPYCRCRAIQVFTKLCDLETKFPKRRQAIAELAARSMEDKSSHVRRNAIKLLSRLVATHPFSALHGGQLNKAEWEARLAAVDEQLERLMPKELAEKPSKGDESTDRGLLDDETRIDPGSQGPAEEVEEEARRRAEAAQAEAASAEEVGRLQLTRRYYIEAIRFIEVIHEASDRVMALLSSRNKSELIEAMDFFVVLDAFKIATARVGIRQMLRLVWTKGTNDDGKGVQAHLLECYKGLFFDAPATFSANEAATFVARNMISLTFGATTAELASLEQLLSTMARAGHISDLVITKLWHVYGVQKREISRTQRCGAAIVLSMLALARPEIVAREMETCLRVGLGAHGMRDYRLARFTCVALGRVGGIAGFSRLPVDHPVLERLRVMVSQSACSAEWFGMTEQAIHAVYALAKFPDVICADIIRSMTRSVFGADKGPGSRPGTSSSATAPDTQTSTGAAAACSPGSTDALAQVLFVVGHVAIKQLVHLDLIEQDFKRRKAEKDGDGNPASAPGGPKAGASGANSAASRKRRSLAPKVADGDELDLVAGTTEDDFTDAVMAVRERELLYGPNSLLAPFGAVAAEICNHPRRYRHRRLQIHATLCLAKLMCVSSEFCDKYLGLLVTVLERSADPVVRSNVVVGLGDLAVCFNHLLDENTDFLYRRLTDPDRTVKHTCLVTLTFLILAGQVKVKGQLGEMAKCVDDPDGRIGDLARMFFTELATKDNAVYNHFIDMFSLLSADPGVSEDQFRRIMRFLLGFVEKDKYAKQLAAKLASRLDSGAAGSGRHRADVAFVLGVLQQTHQLAAVQQGQQQGQSGQSGGQGEVAEGEDGSQQQGQEGASQEGASSQPSGSAKRTGSTASASRAGRAKPAGTARTSRRTRRAGRAGESDDESGDGDGDANPGEDDDHGEDDDREPGAGEGDATVGPAATASPVPLTGRAKRAAAMRQQRRSLRAARMSTLSFGRD